ncbi:MAG TPA: bifunctional glutamate N-acetyltransferase/amino-acid acetyltransferase ArgJ [Chthoniobacterales bacterium]|jgi:glutamate N-acetyltransferase/amino-acid N-acetyltransferase
MPNDIKFKTIPGSICAPIGFQVAAVFCGIKSLGTGKGSEKGAKLDLALIVSDIPAAVAGMFTTNRVAAAPVKVSAACAARKYARAIVVNSGNANACTGEQGMRDAKRMSVIVAAVYDRRNKWHRTLADASHGLAARATTDRRYNKILPNEILVCSTGRIGVPMPMRKVERGINKVTELLSRLPKNAAEVAEAIMTSDTKRKEIAIQFKIKGRQVRIGGICKGAGMIQPKMALAKHATMLGFITTDAAIAPDLLKVALAEAVGQSFNRITVDADMSTNDSVIALANGMAENALIKRGGRDFRTFQRGLTFVCLELAKMIVRDGEGVSRFVTVHIHRAKSIGDAERAARAVASSSLVRTSWCGGDPNWGRILCAVGYSGAAMEERHTDIGYSLPKGKRILYGFRCGVPTHVLFQKLTSITTAPEFDVHVDLHRGQAEFILYASDLTEEYVTFNKGDVTDPSSLGG